MPRSVRITTEPPGFALLIDGAPVGETPTTLSLEGSKHIIVSGKNTRTGYNTAFNVLVPTDRDEAGILRSLETQRERIQQMATAGTRPEFYLSSFRFDGPTLTIRITPGADIEPPQDAGAHAALVARGGAAAVGGNGGGLWTAVKTVAGLAAVGTLGWFGWKKFKGTP